LDLDDFDWLDAPTEKKAVVEKPKKPRRPRRPAALIRAERQLSLKERFYLKLLIENTSVVAANKQMRAAGYTDPSHRFSRMKKKPVFAEALQLAQDYQVKCLGLNKEKILLDAEKIKEAALRPQPILYKGRDTGFKQQELGAALRAIELQSKAVPGFRDDEGQKVQVNIDIDFSGRPDVPSDNVIEGESETLGIE